MNKWDGHVAYDPSVETDIIGIPDSDWQIGFDMTFLSVVRLTRLVVPEMLKTGGGAIVNVSSFAAVEPRQTYPVSAIRAAMHSYAKLVADRYGRDGIRMNSVVPGFLDNWPLGDEVYNYVPMGRPGRLEEVANTVQFLLSANSSYITGQNIVVDGGANRGC